ncbi:hypothetical protein GQ53DRAFT_712517 [Thozetella sp. PMI_491]|nr:hypothetical protein GQ53DRAFT_712517 [Thozetella sp. PMI_491]
MTGNLAASKRKIRCGPKVKTGCATCRIRKVKCDESKPSCRKCVDSGRTCDGYESPFRFITSQSIGGAYASGSNLVARAPLIRPTTTEISPLDVDLLNRYFSTKTIFDVKLGCDEEAKQVLRASLTYPPIRHAVSSLRVLRQHLEMSAGVLESVVRQTSSYDYGLQQYCMALAGLASNLSCPGSSGLNLALICCQIFISIEQVRGNYAAMAQHIIQGLQIMHEYRARPTLSATNKLVPAHCDQLPFLDVFIIKLFAAPCKFADPPAATDISEITMPACLISQQQQPGQSRDLRVIAPNMRTELTRIATSTLEFLGKVSHVQSEGNAFRLLSSRASLLTSLDSWLINLELVHMEMSPPGPELLSVSFMRLFHQILKVVLLRTLDSSSNLYTQLQTENDRLQDIASIVGERVKDYKFSSSTRGSQGRQSKSR